jgi:hypothetical protein
VAWYQVLHITVRRRQPKLHNLVTTSGWRNSAAVGDGGATD